MGFYRFRFKGIVGVAVATLGMLAAFNGCGSSSITTTAPSTPKCQVSVTNPPSPVSAAGTTGTIAIETTRDCTWTATSGAPWIAITSTGEGQGASSLTYRVAPNSDPTPRHAVIGVNDAEVTVAQEPAVCQFSVAFPDSAVPPSGGTITISVTASAPACSWAMGTSVAWISGATASRTGSGSATLTVSPNTGNPRTAVATVAGQALTILQQGEQCDSTITPTTAALDAAGGTATIQVAVASGCGWTTAISVDWLSMNGGSGSGPGVVTVTASANTSSTPRQAAVVIANRTLSITQAATAGTPPQPPPPTPLPAACVFTLGTSSQTVDPAGATSAVTITAPSGCAWSAIANAGWLSFMGASSGTGTGTVTFSAAANPTGAARVGTFTLGGQTFTVSQPAAACAFSMNPASQSVAAAGGTGSVTVTTTAGCAWSATANVGWITFTGASSGTGTGAVTFSAAANTTPAARVGTFSIGGLMFTVSQPSAACAFSIGSASQAVAAAGGGGSVTVTTTAGCAWSATSSVAWISFAGANSGTGTGAVSFSVAANTTPAARVGSFAIGGQTFTVSQAAGTCAFALSAAGQAVAPAGGGGTVTVITTPGCAWSATAGVAWISLTGASAGTGTGAVTFSAAANTTTAARVGTFTVGGQTFTVSQAGAACAFSLSSGSASVAAGGGSGSVTVITTPGCAWSGSSDAGWLTLTGASSGNGAGAVTFNASANKSANARVGTLTIAGQSFVVTQLTSKKN